ncbi:Rpn family recombination-promoting nuclease/putative transposase [Massilia sp. W12]|uniref:Rpn family recombination-promoting nuclease/putative transposase n=1 Tax=Massilia sp. W12 TaxID=3126507 RepID=UPI0030D143DA
MLTERYINLFTDFGFKKVFGEEPNKDLLISFLNSLLPAHHQIADLEFSRTEWQGKTALDRKAVVDLHCKAPDGTVFLVELQKAKQNFFKDRSIFYASFPIQEQAQRGDWDYRLAAVYSIGILDFNFDDADKDDVIHTVQLKNQKNQVFYDKLTFIYLTLPNFKKTLDELHTLLDQWLYLFRHLPNLQEMPPRWHELVFRKLFKIAELVQMPATERKEYEASLKNYRDWKSIADTAYGDGISQGHAQGLEEGLAQGLEQGLAQGKELGRVEALRATVQNARAIGLSDQQICGLTGLSQSELAQFKA